MTSGGDTFIYEFEFPTRLSNRLVTLLAGGFGAYRRRNVLRTRTFLRRSSATSGTCRRRRKTGNSSGSGTRPSRGSSASSAPGRAPATTAAIRRRPRPTKTALTRHAQSRRPFGRGTARGKKKRSRTSRKRSRQATGRIKMGTVYTRTEQAAEASQLDVTAWRTCALPTADGRTVDEKRINDKRRRLDLFLEIASRRFAVAGRRRCGKPPGKKSRDNGTTPPRRNSTAGSRQKAMDPTAAG